MSTFEKIFLAYSAILAVFLTVSAASPLQFILLPLPIYFGWVIFSEIKNSKRKGSSRGLRLTLLDKKDLFISFVVFLILLSIGLVNSLQIRNQAEGVSAVAEQKTPSPEEQEASISTEPQNESVEVRVEEGILVNIREAPDPRSKKIGTAKNGERYPFLGAQGDWYEIFFDNTNAFINKEFATLTAEREE